MERHRVRGIPGGRWRLLKFSQVGSLWQVGGCWLASPGNWCWGICFVENIGRFGGAAGQQRYFRQRITHQFLTVHIKDVIISVTTITKRLLVIRRARMAMYGVLSSLGYKFTLNGQKRHTGHLHRKWEYRTA